MVLEPTQPTPIVRALDALSSSKGPATLWLEGVSRGWPEIQASWAAIDAEAAAMERRA